LAVTPPAHEEHDESEEAHPEEEGEAQDAEARALDEPTEVHRFDCPERGDTMSTLSALKQWQGTVTAASAQGDEAEATATTGTPDRTGDRVLPSGADLAAFWKNPVLLPAHDYKAVPIGTVTSINMTGDGMRVRWRWNADDEQGGRYKRAWDGGFLRALSIGFRPLQTSPNAFGGYDFHKWELLEISVVAIPANPEATRHLAALGLWSESLEFPPGMTPERFVQLCRDAVQRGIREYVDQTVRRFAHRSGSDRDKPILTLDPPAHVQRAHRGNLVGREPDVLILSDERGRR
jgi:HK97 family phage prohead protease